MRRALRLLPALFVLLLAFVLFDLLTGGGGQMIYLIRDVCCALFYVTNFALMFQWIGPYYILLHTWTLAIEEQFYLIWPPLLALLLRRAKRETILQVVIAATALSWLLRYVVAVGTAADRYRVFYGSDFHASTLLLGCATGLAYASGWLPDSTRTQTLLKWLTPAAALGLLLIGIFDELIKSVRFYYCDWCLVSVFCAVLVLGTVVHPPKPFKILLEFQPLVYLGRISYGLYLWHYFIFQVGFEYYHWPRFKAMLITVPLVLAVTLLSYYFVERPFLRLKERFEPDK